MIVPTIVRRVLSPGISKLNWAATFRCNQKCSFCDIWKSNGSTPKDGELSCEELEGVLSRNRIMWLSITGGEPFLREDIVDLLGSVAGKVKVLSIVTNGSRPTQLEKACRKILGANPRIRLTVGISVLGDRSTHDEVTGITGSYSSAIESLHRVYPMRNGHLSLLIESARSSQTEYPSLPKEIGDIKVIRYNCLEGPYYRTANSIRVKESLGREGFKWKMKAEDILHNLYLWRESRNRPTECVACRYSCMLDPYGNVYPCLMDYPHNLLGNVRRGGPCLEGYMNRPIREVVKGCKKCWTPCEAYATIIFRPWYLLS